MESADSYMETLHRAMCNTFNNADEDKTFVKMAIIKNHNQPISMSLTADEMKKPLKSDEPTMDLLLSSMSSTFDAECATGTDEAGSLLNHDLAEDKTIKWRNLVNNKFAYKDNVTYKRGRRLNKKANGRQKKGSKKAANKNKYSSKSSESNSKPKKQEHDERLQRSCITKMDKTVSTTAADLMGVKNSSSDSFKYAEIICKEEVILSDQGDDAFVAVPIKLECIKQDIEEIKVNLAAVIEPNVGFGELEVVAKEALTSSIRSSPIREQHSTKDGHSGIGLRNEKLKRTRKLKEEAIRGISNTKSKQRSVANRNKGKKNIRK